MRVASSSREPDNSSPPDHAGASPVAATTGIEGAEDSGGELGGNAEENGAGPEANGDPGLDTGKNGEEALIAEFAAGGAAGVGRRDSVAAEAAAAC